MKKTANTTIIPGEIWKPIPGYETHYEASSEGRIRSIARRTCGRTLKGKVLSATKTQKGYLRVSLCLNRTQITRKVHKLVYSAFFGPLPAGSEIDHADRDKTNNRPSNLRKSSRSQNHANRPANRNNKSGFKGVHWSPSRGSWVADICVNGRSIRLGRFVDRLDAARAYNAAAIKHFGEFALLNDVPETSLGRSFVASEEEVKVWQVQP